MTKPLLAAALLFLVLADVSVAKLELKQGISEIRRRI